MSNLYIQIVMSLLRVALAGLGFGGLLSDNDLLELAGGLVTVGVAVWGAVNKINAERRLLTALSLPAGADTSAVDARLTNGRGATLSDVRRGGMIVILLGALVATAACASTGALLHRTDQTLFRAVSATRLTVNALCDRGVLAADGCRTAQGELAEVIRAADAFTVAAAANSVAEVPRLLASLERFAQAITTLLPDTSERAAIAVQVRAAIAQLRALVGR